MLNNIKKHCNYGTFYLWIFVVKAFIVLPFPIDGYIIANKGYDLHNMEDFWQNAPRNGIEFPEWQTYAQDNGKQQQQQQLDNWDFTKSHRGNDIWQEEFNGDVTNNIPDDTSLIEHHRQEGYHPRRTSSEIDFEPLDNNKNTNNNNNNVNFYQNAIWPSSSSSSFLWPAKYQQHHQQQQHQQQKINNNKGEQQLQSQHLMLRPLTDDSWTNIRNGKNIINSNILLDATKENNQPSSMGIITTSFLKDNNNNKKISKTNDDNGHSDDNKIDYGYDGLEKNGNFIGRHRIVQRDFNVDAMGGRYDDNEFINDDVNDASERQDNDEKDIENFYRNNAENVKELRSLNKRGRDKKKPKTLATTPFLPVVSGGSMTNLGKFFRDLSKNVQFSEKYQWTSEEQKLLEGDPTLGNLHHHLNEPHLKDDQAGEWIKAIRYYRPSQKIRSLVAMNPHGQWAHGSQFLDPNYMWVGLGK